MIIHQLSIRHLRQDTVRRLTEDPRKVTNDQVFVSPGGTSIIIQVQYGPCYPTDDVDLLDVHNWAEGHNWDFIELTDSLPPEPDLKDYTKEAEERVAEAAPELLAALKDLVNSVDGKGKVDFSEVMTKALAAIAKAEGTQP